MAFVRASPASNVGRDQNVALSTPSVSWAVAPPPTTLAASLPWTVGHSVQNALQQLAILLFLGFLPSAIPMLQALVNPALAAGSIEDRWGPATTKVGDAVPDLVIEDMDGHSLRLSELLGRVVLLSFSVSWCDECNDQAPQLRAIFDDYHDRGLAIVGISYDTDRASAETFRRKHAIPWPIEFTGQGFWRNRIGRLFHVTDTGAILLVNPSGILEGDFRDLTRLRERLDQILLARDPTTNVSN